MFYKIMLDSAEGYLSCVQAGVHGDDLEEAVQYQKSQYIDAREVYAETDYAMSRMMQSDDYDDFADIDPYVNPYLEP